MKKLRRICLFVLALVFIGVLSSVKWTEPRYHLRPISYWLAKYGDGPGDYKPSPEADYALRQMGSNAVPYLLKLLHATNSYSYYTFAGSKYQRGMYPILTPTVSGAGGRLKAWSINLRSRFQRVTVPPTWKHWKAYLAFQALGTEGRSAIPDLVKLASDPVTNSSPSNTGEAPPIKFWKDKKNVPVFAAQSSTYMPHGSPVFSITIFIGFSGPIPQPFLSDAEIAAWSLAAIGSESVPALMGMLTNSNPQIRCRAAMALGIMGKPAEPAVPALIGILHDPDRNTRREAADALGWIGQQPDLVIPALIKMFDDRDVESAAIISLGALGERASNAIPALLRLLQAEYYSGDQTQGQYRTDDIALALNKISPETARKDVIPFMISRIKNPAESTWNKSMTLSTVGQMTNQADMLVPVMLDALSNTPDNYVRNSTIHDLGNFGPAAKAAVPILIPFSTSQDTNLCRLATNALDKIDPQWRDHR